MSESLRYRQDLLESLAGRGLNASPKASEELLRNFVIGVVNDYIRNSLKINGQNGLSMGQGVEFNFETKTSAQELWNLLNGQAEENRFDHMQQIILSQVERNLESIRHYNETFYKEVTEKFDSFVKEVLQNERTFETISSPLIEESSFSDVESHAENPGQRSYVPVKLNRADGQKILLAYLMAESSSVVEGYSGGDRQGVLPAKTDYYVGGGNVDVCWHVTPNEDSDPPNYIWDVKRCKLIVQNVAVVVDDQIITGNNGMIVLEIYRDAASRAYTSHVVKFVTATTPADYTTQQIVIADIIEGLPYQRITQELHVFEKLIVENGMLKLLPDFAAARNSYALPP